MSSSAITGPVFSDNKRAPAGTAAAPSFAFNDSTGTGVYLVSAGVLGLSTNGAQRVVVDASGNVGIGTASPAYNLTVSKNGGGGDLAQFVRITDTNTANSVGPLHLTIGATNHFASAPTMVLSGTNGIAFGVGDGSDLAAQRKVIIDANGNLLVGTTSNINGPGFSVSTDGKSSNATVAIRAHNGAGYDAKIYMECPGVNGGGFNYQRSSSRLYAWSGIENTGPYVVASGTQWTTGSDERMKTDIQNISYGLSSVLALSPKKFKYVNSEKECLGFIAQEVLPIVPEVVDVPEDSTIMLGMEYPSLVPVLVKAIQEQQAQIEALKAEVAALKAP